MYTRRDFGRFALAGLAMAEGARAKPDSKIEGVQIGVQLYSFRDLPHDLDLMVRAMTEVGINSCEFWSTMIHPIALPPFYGNPGTPALVPALRKDREAVRLWRETVSMDLFKAARRKFNDAGIDIYAYNYSFNESFSEREIERGFEMADALGARFITASTTLAAVRRVLPFAEKYRIPVAVHGHVPTDDPNEFASPESFSRAMALSKYIWVNLDVGHFAAGGYDPLRYIRENHERISNIHLKDRLKDNPVPWDSSNDLRWGWGNTPIREVLQLLKKEQYPIPAMIEYEYDGKGGPVAEVQRCYEFCRAALA